MLNSMADNGYMSTNAQTKWTKADQPSTYVTYAHGFAFVAKKDAVGVWTLHQCKTETTVGVTTVGDEIDSVSVDSLSEAKAVVSYFSPEYNGMEPLTAAVLAYYGK